MENAYDRTQLIECEVRRLSEKYHKEYLDCNDLIRMLGIGRDNARALMRSEGFPVTTIGKRKVVSVLSFVLWQIGKDDLTLARNRGNM